MIDVKEVFDQRMLVKESMAMPKHLFTNGNLTFADLRDLFTKMFSKGLEMQECNDGIQLFVTYKDGSFYVAKDCKCLKKPMKFDAVDGKAYEVAPEMLDVVGNSLKDLGTALSCLDEVQLNRFFANGRNFMECKLVLPPADRLPDYQNKCFLVLDKMHCYNDKFSEVGEDQTTADELFSILKNNKALQQETFEISHLNVDALQSLKSSAHILKKLMKLLEVFIDGVGWKCSLNGYIQDRYGRHIVNKALEHGLDVARNSEFVNELAARLSNLQGCPKPTKQDLVTFAKREGVDCRCQQYKDFIADLEQNCEQTSKDIIKPLEKLVAYAALMLMKNIRCFMCIDPSRQAGAQLAALDDNAFNLSETELEFSQGQEEMFKKNLSRIEKYHSTMPASGALIRFKGKVYRVVPNFGEANAILNVIKCK